MTDGSSEQMNATRHDYRYTFPRYKNLRLVVYKPAPIMINDNGCWNINKKTPTRYQHDPTHSR